MKTDAHRTHCNKVVDGILALGQPEDFYGHCEAILKLFEAVPRRYRADVFWELDSRYGFYRRYNDWHPYLRRVRNHPEWGKKLFALWS